MSKTYVEIVKVYAHNSEVAEVRIADIIQEGYTLLTSTGAAYGESNDFSMGAILVFTKTVKDRNMKDRA